MDDCNAQGAGEHRPLIPVQIPLWTIVTGAADRSAICCIVQIPLWTIVTK